MKKTLLVLMMLSGFSSNLFAQSDIPPSELLVVANTDFVNFLTTSVPEETKTMVGFSANDNLSTAVLGSPFKMYTLSSDEIKNYTEGKSLRSMIKETDMWYFPILISDSVKMILYVGKRNGVWERAGLGSAGLARELRGITSKWPSQKGYSPLLIQQYNIGNYLFSIPQVDSCNLTEVGTGPNSLGLGKVSGDTPLQDINATMKNLQSRITKQ